MGTIKYSGHEMVNLSVTNVFDLDPNDRDELYSNFIEKCNMIVKNTCNKFYNSQISFINIAKIEESIKTELIHFIQHYKNIVNPRELCDSFINTLNDGELCDFRYTRNSDKFIVNNYDGSVTVNMSSVWRWIIEFFGDFDTDFVIDSYIFNKY